MLRSQRMVKPKPESPLLYHSGACNRFCNNREDGSWRPSFFMCGIAGYVLRDGQAELSRVRAMCDQIRHRGPDDDGFYAQGGCAIGMRRLSIIDLATGHQPISNEDGSLWVVFNGEIYNYQELRQSVDRAGSSVSPLTATRKRCCTCTSRKESEVCRSCAACSLTPSGTISGGSSF